jgi:P-type E1-E2 ATPase
MLKIAIPSRRVLRLEYLLLDVNGTVALDGQLVPGVRERLDNLSETLDIWLVSADTQGTLTEVATTLQAKSRHLQSGDEAVRKAALVDELSAERVVAIGNGANDAMMLRQAALGIAVLGGEGLSAACLSAADVIAPNIEAALDLLLYPRRLIATLRT